MKFAPLALMLACCTPAPATAEEPPEPDAGESDAGITYYDPWTAAVMLCGPLETRGATDLAMVLCIDTETGCEYLSTPGGLIPRYGIDYHVRGCGRALRPEWWNR
jgi:hypothetical protein